MQGVHPFQLCQQVSAVVVGVLEVREIIAGEAAL